MKKRKNNMQTYIEKNYQIRICTSQKQDVRMS